MMNGKRIINYYLFTFTNENCLGRCPRLAAAKTSLEPFIKPTLIDPKIEIHTNILIIKANVGENL